MPPVFSPISPSPMRLWSMDAGMGTTVFPSVKVSTDTSGPVRNSSITTHSPLFPNLPLSIISLMAFSAPS